MKNSLDSNQPCRRIAVGAAERCSASQLFVIAFSTCLFGCGGGGGGGGDLQFSVGGTVSGLSGSGLVLQLNDGSDLAIPGNGAFSFSGKLQDGSGYVVTVYTQPSSPAQFCSVAHGSGQIHANITDVIVSCSSVQALYPRNGGNWNMWVLNDGSSRNALLASDQPCTIDAGRGAPDACVHAGELRTWDSQRAVACAGLTVRDTLDAFNWVCRQSGSGTAVFTSTGLKRGKKLSDLLDFANLAWRDNRIEVTGTQSFNSPSGKWWSNPVVSFNQGGSMQAETIHVVTENTRAGFDLTSGTGLVVQPHRVVGAPAGRTTDIVSGRIVGSSVWIEGDFDATGADNGIYMQGYIATVLRGVRVFNANGTGIDVSGSSGFVLEDVHAANNGRNGIATGGGFKLTSCSAYNNGYTGVVAGGSWGVAHNRIDGLVVANNSTGLEVSGNDHVLANVTAVNNGLGIGLNGPSITGSGLVAVNNGWFGIEVGANSVANTLADIAAAGNLYEGLRVRTSGSRFTGTIKLATLADCGEAIAGCVNVAPSDALFVIGSGIPAAFSGKVTSDDAANAGDDNGTAPGGSITDWLDFDNEMRGWGKDGAAFPEAGNRGPCVSGTCRIWDWSLLGTDTILRDALPAPTGSDAITHRWSVATSAACSAIPGAVWNAGSSVCTSTFLRRATEISGDGIGNDNGLCEPGETCLHASNYGAYLGHGALISAGTTAGGTVPGVELRRFTANGR